VQAFLRNRRSLLSFALVAGALTASSRADAMGAVVAAPAGASSAVSLRVAVASAAGRTAHWASIEATGDATALAWLIPARPGAALDLSSDAWFEALEAATAPRVVSPDVTPPCGIPGGVEVEGDFTHTATAAPEAVVVAADRPTLDAALATWGMALTSDLAPAVDAQLAAGNAMAALFYTNAAGTLRTRTVRVVDDSTPDVPLGLVTAGASPASVTAYSFGPGALQLAGLSVAMDPAALVWRSDGTSTYAPVRDALLAANPGAWLFETGGHNILFDETNVPGGGPAPAFATSYYFRAASYGDATAAPDACSTQATAVAQSDSLVAPACPTGALARVGAAACVEVVGAGEIDPASLRCGGASDDLAIALSGLSPGQTWVTRTRSTIAASSRGSDIGVSVAGAAAPFGPVVDASSYAQACSPVAGSSGSSGGTPTSGPGVTAGGSSGGNGGSGGGSSSGPSGDPGEGNPGVIVGGAVVASAAANATSDSGGCGGDSSSSGDSCSGDTSSDDGDSGGGCSGTGSGSTSDSGSSDCRVGSGRRSAASRFLMLLVAMATFARRRSRQA
jgi:hypothetical protein